MPKSRRREFTREQAHAFGLGSAPASGVCFGALAETFSLVPFPEKFVIARARSPAREARALLRNSPSYGAMRSVSVSVW